MGLADMFNLDGKDIGAFLVAILLGLLSACLVPAGTWAVLTSILVAYHLFLAWLVITAKNKRRVTLPVVSTIATHLACLILIVPLGRVYRFIPFFGIVGLAIFERGWLFTEDKIQLKSEAPPPTPAVNDSAEDYQAWFNYLAKQSPASRKPGSSLKEEYRRWLLARAQSRPAVPSNESHPGRDSATNRATRGPKPLTNPGSRSDPLPRRAHFLPETEPVIIQSRTSSSMTTGDPSTPLHPYPFRLVHRTSVDMEGPHLRHRPSPRP